jgi:hypothetical protein
VRDDAEPFAPDGRFFRYDRGHEEPWAYEDFQFHMQDILVFQNPAIAMPEMPAGYFVLMSSEGDVYHLYWKENFAERISQAAGTWTATETVLGRLTTLRQIGQRLYACGAGGQIYVRDGRDDWRMLTDAVLFDPKARKRQKEQEEAAGNVAPPRGSEEWIQWRIQRALNPPSRNILFLDIQGLSEEAIYLCGVVGPGAKPVLCYWDGATLEELKVPMEEAALTGIHIENPDSVWVCGREGVLLHGSRSRGFNPVPGDRRLNLFHHITPYRGKLVMPASVRPGGLWEFDPGTGAFGRFNPPLPPLTPPPKELYEAHGGPFFAQAVGDILWVVAPRDIYRFDGHEWERIKHPDLP